MIIKLNKELYLGKFKILESSLEYGYGEIDLNGMGYRGKDGTFSLKEVKECIQDMERIMTGVVRKVDRGSVV
jgi:hypothetical protein